MTVSGRRLNVVQNPFIYFSLNGSYFRQVPYAYPYSTNTVADWLAVAVRCFRNKSVCSTSNLMACGCVRSVHNITVRPGRPICELHI